jgi:hypothetical protein
MMFVFPTLPARIVIVLLAATSFPAHAEDRSELRACQAMVDRAAQNPKAADAKTEGAELQRCRQIVREWMLRDARRSVDEQGRPLH